MTASSDRDRVSELNSKVTAYGNKTLATLDGPGRQQDLVDRAHAMRVANDEIRAVRGTVLMP